MKQYACVRRIVSALFPLFLYSTSGLAAPAFTAPVKLTDGAANYQLSRNPHGAMAVDGNGTVHCTYWSGGPATTPQAPSYVYYQSWDRTSGWSAAQSIDDSTSALAGGAHVGGRQSSLTVDAAGNVTVVWHDHRHGQPSPGNWINNIEIYADRKPAGGSFSSSDLRLTTSSAAHLGDNGYMPAVTTTRNGETVVAWYDFNADADVSDIYRKVSDTSGVFDTGETMAEMRMTNLNDRSGSPAFSVCGAAPATNGVRLIWTSAFAANQGNIYYTYVSNFVGTRGPQLVATGASSYFDPPRIDRNGSGVWGIWTKSPGGTNPDIYAAREMLVAAHLDTPVPVVTGAWSSTQPDLRVGADDRLHLVWLDNRNGGTQVFYGKWDPDTQSFIHEYPVTAAGSWARAAIALDADEHVYILAEEDRGSTAGDIYFLTSYSTPVSSVTNWQYYR